MIYGVLTDKHRGRIGDVKSVSHFSEIVRYLVSPANEEAGKLINQTERVLHIENTFSIEQNCNPSKPDEVTDFKQSIVDSYKQFMLDNRKGKKPPKTRFKHSILSLPREEVDAFRQTLLNERPNLSLKQIDEAVKDFILDLSKQALNHHLSVKEKNIDGLNRQYLMVIHGENSHHIHCHILCNTVDFNNKVFSKPREDLHNQAFCKAMTEKYDFLAKLNYKTTKDYEYTDWQKKQAEQKVQSDRMEKRKIFVEDCKKANLDGRLALKEISKALDGFVTNNVIKPAHIINSFQEINANNKFEIQPVLHTKKSKLSGFSFKIHTVDKTISLKSSLLPERYHFKKYKHKLVDYSQHQKDYEAISSWSDLNDRHTIEETVKLINKHELEQQQEIYDFHKYKSRYLTFDSGTKAYKFKNGFGRLKDRPVIHVKSNSELRISQINVITIKESIKLAKKMGFKGVVIMSNTHENARLFAIEAQKQGMTFTFHEKHANKIDVNDVLEQADFQLTNLSQKTKYYQTNPKPKMDHRANNRRRYRPTL